MHQKHAGTHIIQQILIVRRLKIGVERNRDRADLDRSKKGIQEFGTVRKQNGNAHFPQSAATAATSAAPESPLFGGKDGKLPSVVSQAEADINFHIDK